MEAAKRIEDSLQGAVGAAGSSDCPPRLAEALEYAVFPGGARIRPRLCLAVANACRAPEPELAIAAATAIELLHCASLVHDDMPCFDDAETRRGKPSVHRVFGEQIALLAGDALIVLAFQHLARFPSRQPRRIAALVELLGRATGAPWGIAAGQAWECEDDCDLARYHRAKTGALFAAATEAGALATDADPGAWRLVGARLGEAYQVADDMLDAFGDAASLGKPVGRDAELERPSAVSTHGAEGARQQLEAIAKSAIDAVPECAGRAELRALILMESARFLPADFAPQAA